MAASTQAASNSHEYWIGKTGAAFARSPRPPVGCAQARVIVATQVTVVRTDVGGGAVSVDGEHGGVAI